MCEVVSATTMMYMAIASSAVSVYAQKQTADAQSKAIGVQAENERKEVGAKAEEQLGVRIREAREKRARARVAAGESGAMGQSFAAAMNQSLQDQAMDAALISKNLSFAQSGISDRRDQFPRRNPFTFRTRSLSQYCWGWYVGLLCWFRC